MKNKHKILKNFFGYDDFREGQEYLIDNIISGNDVIGIMPTGAGKSICYQIPALMLEGITVVVSPLISLMKDQVNSLTQLGIKSAYINSALTELQINKAMENAKNGLYKIIYVAPERLETKVFIDFAKKATISMITIDEAHCISQWGQDFRPSYAKVPEFLKQLNYKPIISAFTATATQEVKDDIINKLELQKPIQLTTGFNRKNLHFEVQEPKEKFLALRRFLKDKENKFGVIYCTTRKIVEQVCTALNERGYKAAMYHAGLANSKRQENQEDFLYDRVNIMVATNAFGMGIDKSNVSYVVHYNMPKNIESYYQEAGRAGRDGSDAECLLLFSGDDIRTNLYLIEHGKDRAYLDEEIREKLKRLDRERLNEMVSYCKSKDCLRKYILNYFGDELEEECGNCSNCATNFETIDVYSEANNIIECVEETNERFGANMIIDILRGSKNQKVLQWNLTNIKSYGVLKKVSKDRLSQIIEHLISKDFLFKTTDKFPLLMLSSDCHNKMEQSKKMLMKISNNNAGVEMKLNKEKVYVKIDNDLLNKLKETRLEIAQKDGVPAFVVFSDSTLIDMCSKHPKTNEEMLEVSGVGEFKLQKYGKQFLDVLLRVEDKRQINDFVSEKLDLSNVELSEMDITISELADKVNSITMQQVGAKVSAIQINKLLIEKGYLENIEGEFNRSIKIPTRLGKQLGISKEKRERNGEMYFVNKFNKNAQAFIIEQIENSLIM